MVIGIALVLGLLALAFVLYPLYSSARVSVPAADGSVEQQDAATATEQELTARTALQEVELDYQLGNIAEPEYRSLRERYMQRALVALKSRYEREQSIDEEIEEQLQKMREKNNEKVV